VFQSDRNGTWDIYRIDFGPGSRPGAIGTELVRLTEHPAADQNPAWSPDGRTIAFSSERTGRGDIYVMDADGDNVRRMTDHPAYEGAPRFTPDGKAIVFEGERDGRAEVYRVELETGAVKRLTASVQRKLGPAYSPDGRTLAFMEKSLIRWHVSVRDEDSGKKRAVTRGGGACRPAWSPDGRLLAFVSTRETDKADLWCREMKGEREGSAWRVPTRANAHNYDPAFSPDGRSLAMASTIARGDNEQWDIFVMDMNGRGLVRLTDDEGNERFPDWRP
jgi:TolB protein